MKTDKELLDTILKEIQRADNQLKAMIEYNKKRHIREQILNLFEETPKTNKK